MPPFASMPTMILESGTTTGGGESWLSAHRTGATVVGLEEPTWSTGYTHPLHTQGFVDFLASKGVAAIRLMISWESIQPTALGAIPGGGAATTYLTNLKTLVNRFLAKGIYVSLNPWQYSDSSGDTDITYFGSAITSARFADFWGKLATQFSYDQRISFDLINEPHLPDPGDGVVGITLNNWFSFAQAAITAIRAAGATNYIVVQGLNYADPGNWVTNGSAAKFIALTDTLSPKRLIAGVHNYGTNYGAEIINLVPNLSDIVTHARANGYKFFIETDCSDPDPVSNPPTSQTVTDWAAVTAYCKTNKDVCAGWTWWAADDCTISGWDTEYFHWGLLAAGTNNSPSEWMNLIASTLGTF